jgi:hypothetical protein
MVIKTEIYLDDEVWIVKTSMPQQAHSNQWDETEVFRTLEAAQKYMVDHCNRIVSNIRQSKNGNIKRWYQTSDEYNYTYNAQCVDGTTWTLRAGIYKKTIRQ